MRVAIFKGEKGKATRHVVLDDRGRAFLKGKVSDKGYWFAAKARHIPFVGVVELDDKKFSVRSGSNYNYPHPVPEAGTDA